MSSANVDLRSAQRSAVRKKDFHLVVASSPRRN
jgi:hypothetical protein